MYYVFAEDGKKVCVVSSFEEALSVCDTVGEGSLAISLRVALVMTDDVYCLIEA